MQAFEHMQDLAASLGATLIVEEAHWHDSSSCVALYEQNLRKVRLVWDGKDNCGFVQTASGPGGEWSDPVLRFSDSDFADNSGLATHMFRLSLAKLFGCEA